MHSEIHISSIVLLQTIKYYTVGTVYSSKRIKFLENSHGTLRVTEEELKDFCVSSMVPVCYRATY